MDIIDQLDPGSDVAIEKDTGAKELPDFVEDHKKEPITSITLIGLCTDIASSPTPLIKAFLPEVPIRVDVACQPRYTGVTRTLKAMKLPIDGIR